jgi:hypothetical protein
MTTTSTDAPTMSGTSMRTIFWATTSPPPMAAAVPSTSRTLAMFEPTTLPTAMPGSPRPAEPMLTASSGAEVPKATTVSPTTTGDRPKRTATRPAPRTRTSAPPMRATTPARSIT